MCVYICIWTCVNIYVYVCIYMEFHGQRNLVGYSSWGPKELDMTQWLMHTCIHMLLLFSCCCVRLFETPWTAARRASLSFTVSQGLLKLMSIESLIPSNHFILCRPLLLRPSIFPSIKVFSNDSALCIRWPKYKTFNFSIRLSNEYSGLISFRID